TSIEGKKIRAANLRGKVVVIDCWSTTCSPCMEKMPKLKALYEKYHKDGLEIIGISLDLDAETVRKACASNRLTWPQVLVPVEEEPRDVWYKASEMRGIPRLLVIDRNGVLRADCWPDQLEAKLSALFERPPETTDRNPQ